MRVLASEYARGAGWDRIHPKVRAWIAHAAYGDTWKLRQQIFGQFAFRKGRAV
jgi:hypothetical protein